MLATVSVLGCLLMAGCSDGEDGDPGPKGPDGVDGPPGDPGKDGSGFQESVAYGNIAVSFAGQLPDGKDFADTVNFRYAPLGVNGFKLGSFAEVADGAYSFALHRFYGAVDPGPDLQDNFVRIEMFVLQTDNGYEFFPGQCIIYTHMPTSDTSLLTVKHDFASLLSSDNFTAFQYNPATGDLSFRVDFAESHQQAGVGLTELKVALVATVKVFQEIRREP